MSLQEAVKALRLVKSDLEETRKQRAALEAELETRYATIASLQSKVTALTMELEFYKSSGNGGRVESPARSTPAADAALEAQLRAKGEEVESLKAALAAATATGAGGSAPDARLDALEQERSTLLTDRKLLKAHARKLELDLELARKEAAEGRASLETRLVEFEQRLSEMTDAARDAEVRNNNEKKVLKSQLRRMEQTLQEYKATEAEKDAAIAALSKEKREAEERSNATERETGNVAEQLALLQRQASRVAELEKELAVVQEESRCEAAKLKDEARLAQEAWEAERRRLQDKLEMVAHLRAGLTAETEQLAAQLQEAGADARRLTIETTRLQAVVTEKDEEMARVLAQQSAVESNLREQVSELTKRCTSLSEESVAEVERLKTLLAEGEAKLTAMQSRLADEAVRLQTEWAKVREEADARVEANAGQLSERVKELEEQLKQAHAEGERARSEAAETARVLQAELAASRADAAASEEELRRALESASEAADRARSEADGEVTRQRQELERVQYEQGKIQAATRDEMERLRSEAESERSRLNQECANATAEAAEAGARASELCNEIERLRSMADAERQQLKAELEDVHAAASEARQGADAAQEREAAQLKADVEQARAEHRAVVAALEAAVQARQDETKQAEQAKAEVASMAALLQEREAELAETRAKTSAEAEEVRRDMEQLKAEAQGNAEQLDGLVREKVWLQQQLDKVRSELGLLRGGVEKDLKELQADLERARAEGEERVRQERGQAEARLRAQADEIAALKEQLDEAENRVERAAGVTREAMIKLEAQARETKAKELAIEELRLTKERLEAEVRTAREEAHHQRAAWEQEQQEAGERFAELQARLQVQEQEGERLRATLEAERTQASEHEQAIINMHAELRQRDVEAAGLRADLDKALKEGDEALQAVKSQLSEAEVALQAAQTDRLATEATIEQLQKDKQALALDKKVLKVHIRKLEKQQQENMELSTDSSSTEEASGGQMDELKKALEVADKTRAVLQEQLESQQAQHAAALQQVMRDCEVHAAERQVLEEERASLLQRVQELEAAHLQLAANEASTGRLQDLQHELSEARTRVSMAEEQATEAKARLEAAMTQTAFSKEEVHSLTMQLEARVAEHREEMSRREEALSSMQQALAKAEDQMRAAHDDYRRVNADLIEAEKSFRRQLDAKQDEMSELKENLARAMAQQLGPLAGTLLSGSGASQVEEMKKLVVALTLQVGELEAQKAVLKKQRSFIREESSAEDGLQQDGRGLAQCKELEAQVEGLRREVGDAKARATELAAELRSITGMRECALKDAETARARVAELEAALAQARARESPAKEEHDRAPALSHELSQAKEDVQRLSAQVAEGEAAKDVMAREIKALKAEVEALQSTAVLVKAETEKELESLRWAVTAAEEAVKEKEAWANELATELEASRSREQEAAADAEREGRAGGTSMELAQAMEETESLRARLVEAEAALGGATTEQQELTTELERLREALVRSEESVSTLELAVRKAKEEAARLKAVSASQEEAALQANDTREMLEREMVGLKRALEGAREEAESLKAAHAKCTTQTEETSTKMLGTNGGAGQPDLHSQATTDAPLSSEPGHRLAGGALPQEDMGPSPSPSLQPDLVYGGPTSPPRPPSRLPSLDWVEEDEDLPVPPFGLHDPVIDQLFIAWTSDKAKLDYLRQWLQYIVEDKCTALPANFTPGLQLVNLPPEVKDGFLTLIVPMIKSRQDLQVKVFTRPSGQQPPDRDNDTAGGEAATPYYELRIRILNMNRRPSGGMSGSGGPLTALSPQPGLRRTSSSSPSSFFAGLTSSGPKLFTAMPTAPPPTPAIATGSSGVPVMPESSDRDGPPSLPRKGLLASRVEERLALLQKQGSQGDG